MVERRVGGETGVKAVTYISGDPVWEAGAAGRFSMELAQAACDTLETKKGAPDGTMEQNCKVPHLFLIEYIDGLKAALLMLNGHITEPSAAGYACRLKSGEVEACETYLEGYPAHRPTDEASLSANFWRYYGSFAYLAKNFEEMVLTGQPQYPVERVLLTSGVLEAALTGRYEQVGSMDGACDPMPMVNTGGRHNVVGERMLTPWLDVAYKSYEKSPHRPTLPRPAGALVSDYEDRCPPPSTVAMDARM